MLPHTLNPRKSSSTAFFKMPQFNFEVNKMQSTDYTGSHSEQYYQNPNSKSGVLFVCLLAIGAFLFFAVQKHLITDGFVNLASLFFDSFNIHSNGITGELFLLAVLLLALFGLFCLVKFFLIPLIAFVIVAAVLSLMFSNDTGTKPTLKDTLIHDGRAKESDNVGG